MIEKPPRGGEQIMQDLEIYRHLRLANMFEHPNGTDRVELLIFQIPVVLQPDRHLIFEARGNDASTRARPARRSR